MSHIPKNMRVTTWTVRRDMEKESKIVEKVKAARAYFYDVVKDFDAQHSF